MSDTVNKRRHEGKSLERSESPLSLCSIDGCPTCDPAAGWRNGSSLNNAGTNGNYWSSTPNSDTQNAYNLNFNSGNRNTNWNNRNNGQSVRPVSELTQNSSVRGQSRRFSITGEQLLTDLYKAYRDARRHKRGRDYQLEFEYRLEDNLVALRDELIEGQYRPLPSTCFIIHDPKMREVFAADFRDRIVHHLFYNYTHELFERTFIADSYSCINGRGTHYGIERLKHHILSVSEGWTRPCYVLKLDIKGYFMHINRDRLLEICRMSLRKARSAKGSPIDFQFVDYLLETIILTDPTDGCIMIGKDEWCRLPGEKSMFQAAAGCALPIGNLSSQLFSNIYMNEFDQYAKRTLKCRHYGRYVDDAFVVSGDRLWLKSLILQMEAFLGSKLGLHLHPDKTRIFDCRYGVEFLGAYVRPFRTYVSSSSLRRIRRHLTAMPLSDAAGVRSAVNSYLGVLSHYNSFCLRRVLFGYESGLAAYGRFRRDWLTFKYD